jgi:hypothetical protein
MLCCMHTFRRVITSNMPTYGTEIECNHSVPSFSHSSHPDASGAIEGVSEAIAAMSVWPHYNGYGVYDYRSIVIT